MIIDELERRFPERPIYPQEPRQRLVALLLELYADEWFLLPAMHYRWSYEDRHKRYLMSEFGRMAGPLPGPLARWVGAKICQPFRGSLKFLGVTPTTIPAIEAWFESFLAQFEAHLAEHDYLLGSRPSLAALHCIDEAMRMELAPLGIQVVTVQPSGIQSNFGNAATSGVEDWLTDDSLYAPIRDGIIARTGASQVNATPAAEFAQKLVAGLSTAKPLSRQRIGHGSHSFPTLHALLPSAALRRSLSRKFGLHRLKP